MPRIVVISFVLLMTTGHGLLYAQTDTILIDFENGAHDSLIVLDTSASNIWQIGKPSKVFFDSAWSAPNAIVTDSAGSYPAMAESSFILKIQPGNTVFGGTFVANVVRFRHKYDTEYLQDGGYMELSYDLGATWSKITNGILSYNGTISGGIQAYTGKSAGWTEEWFFYECYPFDNQGKSVYMRFVFRSDPGSPAGKEGWLIDDIIAYGDVCEGVESKANNIQWTISPNPLTDNILQIEWKGAETGDGGAMELYNSLGSRVASFRVNVRADTQSITLPNLPAGFYYVRLNTDTRRYDKVLVVH